MSLDQMDKTMKIIVPVKNLHKLVLIFMKREKELKIVKLETGLLFIGRDILIAELLLPIQDKKEMVFQKLSDSVLLKFSDAGTLLSHNSNKVIRLNLSAHQPSHGEVHLLQHQ